MRTDPKIVELAVSVSIYQYSKMYLYTYFWKRLLFNAQCQVSPQSLSFWIFPPRRQASARLGWRLGRTWSRRRHCWPRPWWSCSLKRNQLLHVHMSLRVEQLKYLSRSIKFSVKMFLTHPSQGWPGSPPPSRSCTQWWVPRLSLPTWFLPSSPWSLSASHKSA